MLPSLPLLLSIVSFLHVTGGQNCAAALVCLLGNDDCTTAGFPGYTCVGANFATGTFGCCTAPTTTTAATTTCVDRTNPSTGVSDCPNRLYLCQNSVYYILMTQQCPASCGRCTATTTTNTTCVDRTNPLTGISDCTRLSSLCTNTAYYTLMTSQCPRTCGRCNSTTITTTTTNTTSTTTCVDLTNPSTGLSECAANRALCTNSAYASLMAVQCRATCGYCTGK